jgi:hypothetical protein
MKQITFKYVIIAFLSFIGGIQFHRGWMLHQHQLFRHFSSLDSSSSSSSNFSNNNDNDNDDNENVMRSDARSNINNNNSTTMTVLTDDAKHHSSTTTTIPAGATSVTAEKIRIILLGERHSGTNWITDHLNECFQGKVVADDVPAVTAALGGNTTTTNTTTNTTVTVTVTNEYTRYKHWYQEDTIPQTNNTIIVVIVLFRDPIDWVEAMRYEPHHAHDHIQFHEKFYNVQQQKHPSNIYWLNIASPLSWKEFVTRPWIGKRGPKDRLIRQQIDAAAAAAAQPNNSNQSSTNSLLLSMNDIQCIDNYQYVDATPCSLEDVTTIKGLGEYKYEYYPDKSERGYSSILQLRALKIRNHLSIRNFTSVDTYLSYQFEKLKINGTKILINDIQDATGLVANCIPIYGKNSSSSSSSSSSRQQPPVVVVDGSIVKEETMIGNNSNITSSSSLSQQQRRRRRQLGRKKVTEMRELSIEYIKYMNRNVNWDVERLIGYFPRIIL